jgi:hypothetical protein
LQSAKRVFRAGIITEDAWDVVTLDNVEQAFSRETSNSSGDAIGRNYVYPDALPFRFLSLTFSLQPLFRPQFSGRDHVRFQKQA